MRSGDLCQMSVSRVPLSVMAKRDGSALYYGAADSVVGVAFTTAEEIVGYIKAHSVLTEEDREIGKR